METKSFNAPDRILMGPGHSNVHPRVLAAMAKPTINNYKPGQKFEST